MLIHPGYSPNYLDRAGAEVLERARRSSTIGFMGVADLATEWAQRGYDYGVAHGLLRACGLPVWEIDPGRRRPNDPNQSSTAAAMDVIEGWRIRREVPKTPAAPTQAAIDAKEAERREWMLKAQAYRSALHDAKSFVLAQIGTCKLAPFPRETNIGGAQLALERIDAALQFSIRQNGEAKPEVQRR